MKPNANVGNLKKKYVLSFDCDFILWLRLFSHDNLICENFGKNQTDDNKCGKYMRIVCILADTF